jgi:hypothetical protein
VDYNGAAFEIPGVPKQNENVPYVTTTRSKSGTYMNQNHSAFHRSIPDLSHGPDDLLTIPSPSDLYDGQQFYNAADVLVHEMQHNIQESVGLSIYNMYDPEWLAQVTTYAVSTNFFKNQTLNFAHFQSSFLHMLSRGSCFPFHHSFNDVTNITTIGKTQNIARKISAA